MKKSGKNTASALHQELLEHAKLLARVLVYEIKQDKKLGDDEGARLKTFTLMRVRKTIAKAEKSP